MIENKHADDVMYLVEHNFGRNEFLNNITEVKYSLTRSMTYDCHIQVDLPMIPGRRDNGLPFPDCYGDFWSWNGNMKPTDAMVVEQGFERFEEILQRNGQVNLHRVFIDGYTHYAILERRQKPLAWQADYISLITMQDRYTHRWFAGTTINLSNTYTSPALFQLSDCYKSVEDKREAITIALNALDNHIVKLLTNCSTLNKQDSTMLHKAPAAIEMAYRKLRIGAFD